MLRLSAPLRVAASSCLVLSLSACASIAPKLEESLESRVEAYHAALIEGDFRRAYGFLSPGYRNKMSFENHIQRNPPVNQHLAAELISKECATEVACRVDVQISVLLMDEPPSRRLPRTSRTPENQPVTTVVPERWLHADGQWWRIPNR